MESITIHLEKSTRPSVASLSSTLLCLSILIIGVITQRCLHPVLLIRYVLLLLSFTFVLLDFELNDFNLNVFDLGKTCNSKGVRRAQVEYDDIGRDLF